MGGVRYPNLLQLSRLIWQWAEKRNIFLFASYIKSKDNTEADSLSRIENPNTEWTISHFAFKKIVKRFGYPKIHLFASRHNSKCNACVSRYPDNRAIETDAFTINWEKYFFYGFPPFSIILKALHKIEKDVSQGIFVVPDWPNQPWCPLFHSMLIAEPLYIDDKNVLSCPYRRKNSPVQETSLIVGRVYGKHIP